MTTVPPDFDAHADRWHAHTATPWGRVRYAVVRHVLTDHLGDVRAGAPRRSVLDVGGGDGLDAAPLARLGHDVVVLDPAEGLLAGAARRGLTVRAGGLDDLPHLDPVDVALCHYVLQYRSDLDADLALLAGALRPGGLLSVVLPNPAHRVVMAFLRSGPEEALAQVDAATAETITFGTTVRTVSLEEALAGLRRAGLEPVEIFGLRVVGDLMLDNGPKHEAAFYDSWERLEVELSRREPFCRTGQSFGVLARRPQRTSTGSSTSTSAAAPLN